MNHPPTARIRSASFACAAVLGIAVLLGAFPPPPSVYRGRMFTGGTANTAAAVNVRFTMNETTKFEDAVRLAEAMNTGSWDAFLKVFRALPKSDIRYTGGVGLQIPCHMAYEEATEKGVRVTLVAEGQPLDPFANRVFYGPFFFLIVVLELDEDGRGEGKGYEDAHLEFTPTGGVKVVSSMSTPKLFVNIRRDK